MKIKFFLVILCVIGLSCTRHQQRSPAQGEEWILPAAPKEIENKIKAEFPGAMRMSDFADTMISYVGKKYGVQPASMLLGTSTCVDDIIYTKDFHAHPDIKGPFHLGGLAGLPFTGISGLEAFAHHIPEEGAMILLVEPHIGISEQKGWGTVLRHGQEEASSCCGALMGALGKLDIGLLTGDITEDDYQEDKIAAITLRHRDEIKKATLPSVAHTMVMSAEAEQQIMNYVSKVKITHIRYIFIITGVLVNTDFKYADYQYVEHFMVFDVAQNTFVEDLRRPFSRPN